MHLLWRHGAKVRSYSGGDRRSKNWQERKIAHVNLSKPVVRMSSDEELELKLIEKFQQKGWD